MMSVEQVRKKACELKEIQTKEQLKREEEQLNRIQQSIMKASATLLSLIISIGNTIVTNFKEKNYNL